MAILVVLYGDDTQRNDKGFLENGGKKRCRGRRCHRLLPLLLSIAEPRTSWWWRGEATLARASDTGTTTTTDPDMDDDHIATQSQSHTPNLPQAGSDGGVTITMSHAEQTPRGIGGLYIANEK